MENTDTKITLKKDEVLCREGDLGDNLFYITKGQLMICSREGRMVTPLAHLGQNEYFGELSFFDALPRSADVVAIEDTTLVKIPHSELKNQMPDWLVTIAQQMAKKLRLLDSAISEKGIKKQNVDTIKPLSIEDQRYYYELLTGEK